MVTEFNVYSAFHRGLCRSCSNGKRWYSSYFDIYNIDQDPNCCFLLFTNFLRCKPFEAMPNERYSEAPAQPSLRERQRLVCPRGCGWLKQIQAAWTLFGLRATHILSFYECRHCFLFTGKVRYMFHTLVEIDLRC